MTVTVAIDSFKGSLSTFEAAAAVKDGIRAALPDAKVFEIPLADGGEGTVKAIASVGAELKGVTARGPLGTPVTAEYCLIQGGRVAVIEMAAAAGLTLIPDKERNPMLTSTYGVGELIRHVIENDGCREIIIGIGGSATNDGGVGMLSALGFRFLDENGESIPNGCIGLKNLSEIDTSDAMKELCNCSFTVACDVDNPLTGERGASAVFSPQKGASEVDVPLMDAYLGKYADLTASLLHKDMRDHPGAGAAGGLGFALISYLGATLRPGIELVSEAIDLDKFVRMSDLVITGEGRLDGQSAMGKAPVGVAKIANRYGKICIALSGCIGKGAAECNNKGIDAFFPILQAPCSLEDAMSPDTAKNNLKNTAEQVMRLVLASTKIGEII